MDDTSATGQGGIAFEADRDLRFAEKRELTSLIALLRGDGFKVLGPRVEDVAIVYDEVESLEDLPQGYSETQAPGCYRIAQGNHENYFQFTVGPNSWKQFLFPSRVTLSSATRNAEGWTFSEATNQGSEALAGQEKLAFVGVRACELAAIAIQDRVFLEGPYVDPVYQQRRETAFIVAVNCTMAASTCFCTSTDSGPKCQKGFDLAITELPHGFLFEAGSQKGEKYLQQLETCPASPQQKESARQLEEQAVQQIDRKLETHDLRDLLLNNLDHPHWDNVATRCLSCTNCTMVCPTCFCSSVHDVADLSGDNVERVRQWDSCFNLDFSYTKGGTVRDNTRSRFRQWLTHKLASWQDQFDSIGCVGCGRCITWCPVGIDLTEEVQAIRLTPTSKRTLRTPAAPTVTTCAVKEEDD